MHKASANGGDNKCMNIYEVLKAVGFGNMPPGMTRPHRPHRYATASIHPFIYPSVIQSVRPSMHPSIIHRSIHSSANPFTRLCIDQSIHQATHPISLQYNSKFDSFSTSSLKRIGPEQ